MEINGFKLKYSIAELKEKVNEQMRKIELIDENNPAYTALSDGDKKALEYLADAAKIMNNVALEMDNPHNLAQKKALEEKKKLEEINFFDEKLAVSYNDVDLCLKLLKKGYYNVFVPEVKLIHYESKTRGYDDTYEKMYRTYTEVLYMRKKWGNILLNDCFYNPNFSLHFPFKLNEEMKKRKK